MVISNTDQGHSHLQRRIEAQGALDPVHESPQQQPAQREPGKEGAHAGGDGIDVNPDDQRQLLDPEHLINQCGRAGRRSATGRATQYRPFRWDRD